MGQAQDNDAKGLWRRMQLLVHVGHAAANATSALNAHPHTAGSDAWPSTADAHAEKVAAAFEAMTNELFRRKKRTKP